jgi:hypothetical protein
MPALRCRTVKTRRSLLGRRRTSLEGGNRGMPRRGAGGLVGYGDLMVRTRAVRGNRADRAENVMARMSDGAEARPDSGRRQRARNKVTAARGEAVRYRRGPMKSGRPLACGNRCR